MEHLEIQLLWVVSIVILKFGCECFQAYGGELPMIVS